MDINNQQSTEGEVSLEAFFDMTPEVNTETVEKTETKQEEQKPEVVEQKEEVKPEVKAEEKEPTTTETEIEVKKPTGVLDKVKLLIENGVLEDTRVSTSDDEEDEGVLLSEFSDITDEQLEDIKALQKEKKDKELQDKYISKDGLNDNHLKIVEFLKNGGDLKEVFEQPEQAFQTPYENLDLTDVKIQQAVALRDYINNKGLSREDAMDLVSKKQANFELDSLVTSIVEKDITEHNERISNMAQTQEQKRKEREETIKSTRKALTSTFKENKIKDNVTKKVVDSVTNFSQKGNSLIEETFKELLKNPEKHYLTLLHVADPEAFNELHKIQESKKVTNSVLRLRDKAVSNKTTKIKDQQDEKAISELEALFADVGPITK